MLRPLQEADIDRLLQLWLHLACSSHPSLPVKFWLDQGKALRRELGRPGRAAQIGRRESGTARNHWVYTRPDGDIAEGLVTISDGRRLDAVFVSPMEQGHGVGSELVAQAKAGRVQLEARVLEENLRGRFFLQQQGFVEAERRFDDSAGQEEILMVCNCSKAA